MIAALASLIDLVPLAAVPAVLVLLFLIAAEIGFRYHRRFGGDGGAEDEVQVLSTALLVLALLLGFTFSMALSRYDERRQLVVQEANDIGTAWLRAGLVPAPHGPALQLDKMGAGFAPAPVLQGAYTDLPAACQFGLVEYGGGLGMGCLGLHEFHSLTVMRSKSCYVSVLGRKRRVQARRELGAAAWAWARLLAPAYQ